MKDRIIQLLDTIKKPLNENELYDKLKLENISLTELCNTIRIMELNGDIYKTNSGKYTLFKYTHLIVGRLSVNRKGFGFLLLEDAPDIYIHSSNMKDAIHNDLVAIEKINKEEGKIVKVINRELKNVVGELYFDNNEYKIKIDTDKIRLNIIVDKENRNNAMPGHIVLVEPFKQIEGNRYEGKIIKILGHKNDPGMDILQIVYEHNINEIFPKEVIEEVNNIKDEVLEKDYNNRKDLRNDEIFTIDGDDAKDFDDAVSIKILDNGNYKLGVHIADVSNYVKPDSKLNEEAFNRGNSVYLIDRVIPMLPHKLSNGICSLNEGVDRLTITCDMEIDTKGKIINYDIYESVINSKKRMTYKEVNRILENNEFISGYESFIDSLNKMFELSKIIRKSKIQKGYIDFDIDEPYIEVDEAGKPIEIKVRDRGVGEKLIEDFMIITNETIASYVFWLKYPFIYRVHGIPKEEKIENFLSLIRSLGHTIKGSTKNITPKFIQQVLDSLKESDDFEIISSLGLRSMQKAVYSPENIGHFGLASEIYTHFTSPIRRYSDLVIHSLLKGYLKNNFENKMGNLSIICEHISTKERDAIECERDVNDMKMAEYMMNHIGEEYEGMISGLIPSGIFVRLPNLIEGFVHVSELGEDYFVLNEATQMFIGKDKGKKYKLGDKLKVKVANASKEERTIDFDLI
ncbi:MAG: ribonuclease R [Bacilli bacterium]|nr:ribonuclease R [Bacilli bacterium]